MFFPICKNHYVNMSAVAECRVFQAGEYGLSSPGIHFELNNGRKINIMCTSELQAEEVLNSLLSGKIIEV